MNTYMHICILAYLHEYIQAYMHACMHTCIHAYMITCIHPYVCIRTYNDTTITRTRNVKSCLIRRCELKLPVVLLGPLPNFDNNSINMQQSVGFRRCSSGVWTGACGIHLTEQADAVDPMSADCGLGYPQGPGSRSLPNTARNNRLGEAMQEPRPTSGGSHVRPFIRHMGPYYPQYGWELHRAEGRSTREAPLHAGLVGEGSCRSCVM